MLVWLQTVNSDLSVNHYFSNGLFRCSDRAVRITCQGIDQSTQKAGKKAECLFLIRQYQTHKCSGGNTPFCQATNRQTIRKRTRGGIEFDLGYVCAELEFRFTIFFLSFIIYTVYVCQNIDNTAFSPPCDLDTEVVAIFSRLSLDFFLFFLLFFFKWVSILMSYCIAICCYFDESVISLTSLLWQGFK